jgi:hypothetical protein
MLLLRCQLQTTARQISRRALPSCRPLSCRRAKKWSDFRHRYSAALCVQTFLLMPHTHVWSASVSDLVHSVGGHNVGEGAASSPTERPGNRHDSAPATSHPRCRKYRYVDPAIFHVAPAHVAGLLSLLLVHVFIWVIKISPVITT